MNQPRSAFQRILAYAISSCILVPGALNASLTEISNEPLATPAANVKPNVMLILDDSFSMEQQYTPDYLGRRFYPTQAKFPICFDGGDDSSGSINTALDDCEPGDPPLMSPDINTQYYSPEIRYYPAVNFDGTSKPIMNAIESGDWTKVETDGVSPFGMNTYRRTTRDMAANVEGTTVTETVDLTSEYPDRVWCDLPTRLATDTTNCRTNSGYTYPNSAFPYGRDSSTGPIKFRNGAPYYYRLLPTEYCTDASLTTCTATTAPTGSFVVPAPQRYCTDSTLTNCQAKFKPTGSPTFTYPKFVGNVALSSPGAVATGTLTVTSPQKDTAGATITSIVVNGVNIISGSISLGASFTASTAATQIAAAINSFASSPNYTATVSSNVVTITYAGTPSQSAVPNGFSISPTFNITSHTSATSTATMSGVAAGDSITEFTVSGQPLIATSVVCPALLGCGANNNARNAYMATRLAAAINAGDSGYTATAAAAVVTITAPPNTGSALNGITAGHTSPGMTVTKTAFASGITAGNVDLTTANFSGGADAVGAAGRQFVGNFTRVNIVPFQDPANTIPSTFPRYAGRSDCAGVTCTYEEEMTNFANWYAYYRSRMQMAKTAIGRAFAGISDAFRVGFITINPAADLTNRFLAVDDFRTVAGGQRDLWYQQLYKQDSHGRTPLREALSRVGRYYGGVTTGINAGMPASPIQNACQPSYAILTTDGYWNDNAGVTLTGTAIGNQDNVDSGYSKRSPDARYDGALSGATNTLADVAMYYYKTDLRADLADQVPVTTKDTAPHQHMTTFTVGMGLAGQLNFAQNYEDGGSADFERLKTAPSSGGLDWPVPAADQETALDDLWHAAVNGRGTFFSAKDPAELTNGIVETLNAVNARVGAGAAAATSNLQPVAGDNFAYTAQYQTVDWIGDLKAKTIDLSSGTVAFRELWSAAALLDQRSHLNRRIFTFDPTDGTATAGDPSATPPVQPTNGNRLKSFCAPASVVGGALPNPACDETAGLSATEMSYFEPVAGGPPGWTRLVQAAAWLSDGSGRNIAANKEKLVDYLRGDTSNEIVNAVTPTTADLFRNRLSLLGDIVNAQPAYVKGSPFGYNTGNFAGRDPYYAEFKNTTNGITSTRKGTVFSAANDGVLHAFETDPDNNPYFQTAGITTTLTSDDAFTGSLDTSATGGEGAERWAYIPSMLLPNLMRLADAPYSHRFYNDGSPVVGDVCFGHTDAARCSSQANWRTILVGGLNAGGRGYYALDITNPDSPKGLWEFKGGSGAACILTDGVGAGQTEDCNVGFSYGNPLIVKLPASYTPAGDAGKWVVIFTSGYNNVSPGDGVGHLYIVDAQTGRLLRRVSTAVGDTTTPSGLGRINAWVDDAFFDNTALTLYGGDLRGNLWRYQLAGGADVAALSLARLTTLVDFSGAGQPITTKPELGEVSGKRVVFVATGRFVGDSDKSNTQKQTIYAIKDEMNDTTSPPPIDMTRGGSVAVPTITGFVRQDFSALDANTRTTTKNTVAFGDATVKGWFIDLPDGATGGNGSERVNVDMVLQLGTLVVPSNVPSADTCVAGGFGWLNFIDYKTGGYVEGATLNMTSRKVSGSLVVGINVVQLPGGMVKTIATTADNQQLTSTTPVAPSSVEGRRVSWRELFFE
jgi:type IV pilus assembly protein PilY1